MSHTADIRLSPFLLQQSNIFTSETSMNISLLNSAAATHVQNTVGLLQKVNLKMETHTIYFPGYLITAIPEFLIVFSSLQPIMSSCIHKLLQFKASLAKPWTKLRLVVYTCNYHPGSVLSDSWHPKYCLLHGFLINLIRLQFLFCLWLLPEKKPTGTNYSTQDLRKALEGRF